ncbi:glutaminase [Microbacterium sp. nov. GSS16]|uniref:glutaminase n=1 Tax=Microbacterium sp. nov. GSS16 TaxID=3019890 RepID=UPI0023067BEB|nr:glutaminase [Microbacterium sp. nov. GSS16]WCD93870.1 glutaminase [Microbacterium sp. nov. GSS16]
MGPTEELLRDARARLAAAPRESLGRERTSRWRADRIVPAGAAWHLGVLLLTDEGVLSTAEILRAAEPVRRGYTAESARARAERRAQARRGGFAEGEVVHVGWQVLDAAAVDAGGVSGPLALVEGVPSVRWSPGGLLVPLQGYLDERIALAIGT